MIHFSLRCAKGHEFEGWFRDGAAYDKQAKGGKIARHVWDVGGHSSQHWATARSLARIARPAQSSDDPLFVSLAGRIHSPAHDCTQIALALQ